MFLYRSLNLKELRPKSVTAVKWRFTSLSVWIVGHLPSTHFFFFFGSDLTFLWCTLVFQKCMQFCRTFEAAETCAQLSGSGDITLALTFYRLKAKTTWINLYITEYTTASRLKRLTFLNCKSAFSHAPTMHPPLLSAPTIFITHSRMQRVNISIHRAFWET